MVRGKYLAVLGLAWFCLLPLRAQAGNILRIGENAIVPPGEKSSEVVVIKGSAEIGGRVEHNVVVILGKIHLQPSSWVGGDVICLGGAIQVDPGARVNGSKVEVGGKIGWKSLPYFALGRLMLLGLLYKILTAVLMAGLAVFLVWMWPQQIRLAGRETAADLVTSSLVGLLATVVLIPLAIGFAVTLFGLPISLALILFFLVAHWFGITVMAYLIGQRISHKLSPAATVVVGILLLKIIHFLPLAGGMLYFIATLPGLGAILLTRFGTNKPWLSSGKNKV